MDVRDGVKDEFEIWANAEGWPVDKDALGRFRDRHVDDIFYAWQTATARAYGNGYRAGFRAASGEVEQ